MAGAATMSQGQALKEFVSRTLTEAFLIRGVADVDKDKHFARGLADVESIGDQITGDLDVAETSYIRSHYRETGYQNELYRRVADTRASAAWTNDIFASGNETFGPFTAKEQTNLGTMPDLTSIVRADVKLVALHDQICTRAAYKLTWRLGARIAAGKGAVGGSITTTQARSNALMLLALTVIYKRSDSELIKARIDDYKTPDKEDFKEESVVLRDQRHRYPLLLEKWAVELLAHWGLAVTEDGVTSRVGVLPDGDTDSRATAFNRKALNKFVKTKQAGTTLGIMGLTLKAWETLDPQGWECKSALGSYIIAFATQPSHKSKLFPDPEKSDKTFLEAMGVSDLVATDRTGATVAGAKKTYVIWTTDEWSAWRKEADRLWKDSLDEHQRTYERDNGADSLSAQ
jgi:hypothetical protein